jgi:histidinol phosphatase-like PHP family hydrolase
LFGARQPATFLHVRGLVAKQVIDGSKRPDSGGRSRSRAGRARSTRERRVAASPDVDPLPTGRREAGERDPNRDTNLVVAGLLSDLATIQTSVQRHWGYRRAARAIRWLDESLDDLLQPDGTLPRISGIGPASLRVIEEVLRTGRSEWVERAVEESSKRDEVAKRRALRAHFLSRARVRAVLEDPSLAGPRLPDYHGDLQMHSTWSDGTQSLRDIVETGIALGYSFSAVTDHSAGLPIAKGVSSERFAEQRREIDRLNEEHQGRFRLLKGVEANIRADGEVDVDASERGEFDVVVAAPHSSLRKADPQTERMLRAVATPGVHILGHPRGRIYGSRPGITADWPQVFATAASTGVAIEIDGDPFRQDLDSTLAREALDAGCLFALDSDAHAVDQWSFSEYALAHARLAGIPAERIVNCWSVERLLEWARTRRA